MTNTKSGGPSIKKSHQFQKDVPFQFSMPSEDILKAVAFEKKHVNNILQDIGFKITTHEHCIYQIKIKNQQVLFLWQVNDFAVVT